MDWDLLLTAVGASVSAACIAAAVARLLTRRMGKKGWEEDRATLLFLLAQSAAFLSTVVVNSVYRPVTYPIILFEYAVNSLLFFLAFTESLHRRKFLASAASALLFLLLLL